MRIAHIAPFELHPYSGVLTALTRMAEALAKRGHDVEVWQLHDWPEENREFVRLLDRAGVTTVRVDMGRSPWRVPPAAIRVMAGRHADVAHLHGVFGPANNFISRELPVPFVISPHGGYAGQSLSFHARRKRLFKGLELAMLRRAASVCALTEQEAAELREFGYQGPVAVVPNGVKPPEAAVDEDAFRAELGIGPETLLAVYIGRIDVRHKRLDSVVSGIAASDGWHVALLGGDFRDGTAQLRRLAAELQAGDRLHFPPPRRGHALFEALRAADVFVLASRFEGMSMALLEALAVGTPAVVSPEVDRTFRIGAAGAGWVAEPHRLAALLDWIAGTDRGNLAERGAAGLELARRHDWAQIAAEYEQVYSDVLASVG